jgi:predicted alpha/beta hydrolase
MHQTVHSFRTPEGVTLGVEHFGDAAAPLVLLAGGTTMLSWPDALCETLARGGRHVVRYDLRDSGASTTVDPEAPAYTLRDLAAERVFDRTPGTEPAVQMANQMAWCSPSSTASRGGVSVCPSSRYRRSWCTVVATGFFPVGNGEALAREIPGARLLVLEQAATAIPDAAADEVAAAMLAL